MELTITLDVGGGGLVAFLIFGVPVAILLSVS